MKSQIASSLTWNDFSPCLEAQQTKVRKQAFLDPFNPLVNPHIYLLTHVVVCLFFLQLPVNVWKIVIIRFVCFWMHMRHLASEFLFPGLFVVMCIMFILCLLHTVSVCAVIQIILIHRTYCRSVGCNAWLGKYWSIIWSKMYMIDKNNWSVKTKRCCCNNVTCWHDEVKKKLKTLHWSCVLHSVSC